MSAEAVVADVVGALVTVIEAGGAAVIAVGVGVAFGKLIRVGVRGPRTVAAFLPIRLSLARYLALGLEFQLAGDLLRTAVSPSLQEIAQLAAIAAIRTGLNFFLSKEIADERRQVAEDDRRVPRTDPPTA